MWSAFLSSWDTLHVLQTGFYSYLWGYYYFQEKGRFLFMLLLASSLRSGFFCENFDTRKRHFADLLHKRALLSLITMVEGTPTVWWECLMWFPRLSAFSWALMLGLLKWAKKFYWFIILLLDLIVTFDALIDNVWNWTQSTAIVLASFCIPWEHSCCASYNFNCLLTWLLFDKFVGRTHRVWKNNERDSLQDRFT